MFHRIITRGLCFCITGFLALAAATQSESPEAKAQNEWFKRFYQTHDLKPFDGFWREVITQAMLEDKNRQSPIIGFASQVFRQHPELLQGRIDAVSAFPQKQQEALRRLLQLANCAEAQKILQADDSKQSRPAPPAIKDWKIKDAGDLDLCWGYFFATGDTAALDPIITALAFGKYAGALERYKTSGKTKEDKAAAYKDAIFGSAMWSLGANAKEDPRIAAHLEKVFNDPATPKDQGLWLAAILSKLMPQKYTMNLKPGGVGVTQQPPSTSQRTVQGFMAIVLATSDPDWKAKWETPAEVTPQLSTVTKLKIGERATVLVLFANPQLDPTSGANVTCDIKITRPNGKITEMKDQKGYVGALKGAPTNLYLANCRIGFVGDPGDPLGEWVFDVTVRDNVRQVAVPVTTRFTLEKP
ncbi:MAG: hypothetical protein HZA31_09775 [Opitutae bacterium]|nr:hypothetical protein [Opitutae bacterium]